MGHSVLVAITIAMAIFASQLLHAHDFRISGSVNFKDENGNPNTPEKIPDILLVNVRRTANCIRCPGEAPVSTETLEYSYGVPVQCLKFDDALTMGVRSRSNTNISWTIIPPRPMVNLKHDVFDYVKDINVLWKQNPTRSERNMWYSAGEERLGEKDFDVARFAYVAAGRGNDYEYTAAAANALYDAGRESDILALYKGKNLDELLVDDKKTLFKFTMRKANAARATALQGGPAMDKFFFLALDTYRKALEIYPKNADARSLAYETIKNALNTRDPETLAARLEDRADLQKHFQEVYEILNIDQKLPYNLTDGLNEEIESWRQSIITIP